MAERIIPDAYITSIRFFDFFRFCETSNEMMELQEFLPYSVSLGFLQGKHIGTLQRWVIDELSDVWSQGPYAGQNYPYECLFYFLDESDAVMFKLRWGNSDELH